MKPSFALNFTDSNIGLLHRTLHGWLEVGSVGLDDPDLAKALAYLRGSALGLEPRGITTKLILPNSQIRYLTVPAPGPDAASRQAQIREALEGKTPYAVDELAFDWSGTGKTVQVAIVARETLEEAEAFARDNRFNPVSFVAVPEPGTFAKEPWFGPTTLAPSILAKGEKVERDEEPIKIVGRAPKTEVPVPGAAPAPEAAAQSDARASDQSASKGSNHSAPEGPAPAASALASQQVLPPEAVAAEPEATLPGAPEQVQPSAKPGEGPATKQAPPAPETVQARVTGSVIADRITPPGDDLADLPPIPPARIAAAVRAAEAMKPRAADSARKAPPPAGRATGAKPPQKPTDIRPTPVIGPPRLTAVPGGGGGSGARSTKIAPVEAEWPVERVAAARAGKGEAARGGPMVTAPSIAVPSGRKLAIVPPAAGAPAAEPAGEKPRSEADTMAVFGARTTPRRGKPRYLFLILVSLLLAVLAAVYIWSAIVQASRESDRPALASAPASVAPEATAGNQAATVAPPPEPGIAAAVGPDKAEALADPVPDTVARKDPPSAADAAPANGSETATPAPGAGLAEAVPEPAPKPEPAPVDGAALTAATGDAEAGRAPGNEPQDEIFLSVVENRVSTSDATALTPPAAAADAPPGAQPLPPPFGTLYQFDAEGRIVPTPEGVVTPEGVRLVAGKPPRLPQPRPEPPALPAQSAAEPAAPAVSAPAPSDADPALVGARPRPRPDGLAPAAQPPQATDDDASLTVADTTRLSSLKPRARPPELLARGEAELAQRSAATAATSAAAQSASASLVATLDEGPGSPLAVAVSRRPAARPQALDRSIEAAVQIAAADASLVPEASLLAPGQQAPEAVEPPPAAVQQPKAPLAKGPTLRLTPQQEEPAPTSFSKEEADDPAAVELDEPESGGKAASAATRSIVARKATYANALNMSKISLIGVFGSPSNRYAMVRQPGGRFVKVEVGDRIDGGKIAAISEREVSYIRDGQTHTLTMPKG
jgi:hypothetical protein